MKPFASSAHLYGCTYFLSNLPRPAFHAPFRKLIFFGALIAALSHELWPARKPSYWPYQPQVLRAFQCNHSRALVTRQLANLAVFILVDPNSVLLLTLNSLVSFLQSSPCFVSRTKISPIQANVSLYFINPCCQLFCAFNALLSVCLEVYLGSNSYFFVHHLFDCWALFEQHLGIFLFDAFSDWPIFFCPLELISSPSTGANFPVLNSALFTIFLLSLLSEKELHLLSLYT